jgi:putative toxin-antitoxin system antitoxin component (TIGR02293 family)
VYPVDIAKVTAALGGPRVVGAAPRSLPELAAVVAHGLPRGVVREVAAHAAPLRGDLRNKVAALVVSPATYKRSQRLSPAASERAERLARVAALAAQALGSEDEAKTWLNTPHLLLGDQSPIEVAASDLGARQVERILINIEHGLPV